MVNGIWCSYYHSPSTRALPARVAIPSAATTATAIAAATTATSPVAAKAATPAATATIATIFAWPGFIDSKVATVQISSIELFNCLLAVLFGSHLDKSESARASGVTIFDNGG